MFAKCMTSEGLIGKIPAAQLKRDASVYEKRGMAKEAALIKAVEDKLSMLALEEKKIIKAVRTAYQADGGPAFSRNENSAKMEAQGGQTDGLRSELQADENLVTISGGKPAVGWRSATRLRRTNGEPAAVYRGAAAFLSGEHFDRGSLGHATGHPSSGLGVWFSLSEQQAAQYGEVEQFHLDVRNPKVFSVEDLPSFDTVDAAHQFREKLIRQGHDGILVDARGVGGPVNVVAFKADQVVLPGTGIEVASLSRSTKAKTNPQVTAIKAAIAADTFNHEVDVYASMAEAPDYIRTQAEREGATDVEGFFDPRTNRVALIADNLASPERAREVARHELIGHYGLENMVGRSEMTNLATRVIKAEADGNKVIADIARQVDATQPGLTAQRRAKEIMAVMAERNLQNSITKRVIDAVRKFLKQAGFLKSDITDAEIAGLLRDAQSYLKQQGREMEAGEAAPAFSREKASMSRAGEGFTPSNPDVRDDIIRAMQNNKIDLKRVQDAIKESGGTITERQDAYLNEELYIGKLAAQFDKFNDKRTTPLLEAIKKSDLKLEEVDQFLYARHAPEANARLKALNPTGKDNTALSGMSDAKSAQIMAGFKASGKHDKLNKIAGIVDMITKQTRQRIVAQGLETADMVGKWEAAYQHYVPLRVDDDIAIGMKNSGFTVRGPESQRRLGQTDEAKNILANVLAQAQSSIKRAEKAKVGRSLLDLARAHPNKDFWTVDKPVRKREVNPETGLMEWIIDPHFKEADNVLVVKENGEDHYIVMNKKNPRAMQLAAGMKNLDAAKLPWLIDVAGKGTRYLAQWITARNPLFWVTNFARDLQGAAFNLSNTPISGKEAKVLASIPQAMKGYWKITRGDGTGKWATYAKEFKSAGSETGFVKVFESADDHMADLEKQFKQMEQSMADPRKLARSMVDMIDDYNTIIENGVRLAVYQTGRESGMTIRQAASMAKNITVNFNRRGNQTVAFNSLYMFMNANIQGNTRFLTAVATSRKAQAVAASLIGMGLVLDIMARAFGGDDDETGRKKYDLINDFEKERNWIFMHPDGSGKYAKIPMPIGVHIMPNIGRLISESLFSSKKQDAVEKGLSLARIMVDAFNPMGSAGSFGQLIAPSILKPVVQIGENKSFHGGPAYKAADGRGYEAPAYTRHFKSTAEHWTEASKLLNDISGGDTIKPGQLNVPPEVLRTLIMSYVTPGITQNVDKTIDTSRRSVKGEKIEPSQIPALSRFYGEAPEERAKERAYYEEQRRIKQSVEQIKQYDKARDRESSNQVYADLGDGSIEKGRRVRTQFEIAEKALRGANKDRKVLEKDKRPDDEQRAELDRNKARRLQIMQRLLKVTPDDEDD